MPEGWMHPRSGRAQLALVPPPPWHFSAELLVVDFVARPEAVAGMFVPGVEPAGDGSASVVFGAWSAAADHDERLVTEPARGQYHEAYVVVYGTLGGKRAGCVAGIWADSDQSIVRGIAQGFTKKLGSVALSRAVTVGRGGPKRAVGGRFHASASSMGRLLAQASVSLTARSDDRAPSAVAVPLIHRRFLPDLSGGQPLVDDLVRNHITDFTVSDVYRGDAAVNFFPSEFEDVDRLLPVEVTGGWIASLGYTLLGATRVTGG
jgi:acetoacetate decarboxylase